MGRQAVAPQKGKSREGHADSFAGVIRIMPGRDREANVHEQALACEADDEECQQQNGRTG